MSRMPFSHEPTLAFTPPPTLSGPRSTSEPTAAPAHEGPTDRSAGAPGASAGARGGSRLRSILKSNVRSAARRAAVVTAAVAAAGAALQTTAPASHAAADAAPYRGFPASSYWNTPLPTDAPADPHSADFLKYMTTMSVHPFVMLSGLGSDYPAWGMPIYWAKSTDPVYHVVNTCSWDQPAALQAAHIPRGALPAPDSDSEITIYDLPNNVVVGLWHAHYDAVTDTWSACGGERYGLSSDGLHVDTGQSDDPDNWGHRGIPATTSAVRLDEIRSGSINHVLNIGTPLPGPGFVFPMVGSDGQGTSPYAPPEGTRLRIRPDVDLSKLGLSPAALVVARALQQYGAVLGDGTGAPTSIKVENCRVEGKGDCWNGLLDSFSLQSIPLSLFQVVKLGWDPRSASPSPTSSPVPTSPAPSPSSSPTASPVSGPSGLEDRLQVPHVYVTHAGESAAPRILADLASRRPSVSEGVRFMGSFRLR